MWETRPKLHSSWELTGWDLLTQAYERLDRGFIISPQEGRNKSPRVMSTRLVSTMKKRLRGRLRKSKEGVWGVTIPEEADVGKFGSLWKIPGSSCYWMQLVFSGNGPLTAALLYDIPGLLQLCRKSLWPRLDLGLSKGAPRILLVALIILPLDTQTLMEIHCIPRRAPVLC